MYEASKISADLIQAIKKQENQTRAHPGRHTTAIDEFSKELQNKVDLLLSESPLPD